MTTTKKLADYMKTLERVEAARQLDSNKPIIVRLDGKGFSNYTKKLNKPFDARLSKIMIECTKFLMEQSSAALGYTQSDEISLVFIKKNDNEELFFAGKVQKITSILASMLTAKFNQLINQEINEKKDVLAYFDCRAWNTNDLQEALQAIVWRRDDAIKNSISMAASHYYSHNQLHKKNSKEKLALLLEKSIDWNDYAPEHKVGTALARIERKIPMPEEYKHFPGNKGKDEIIRQEIQVINLENIDLNSFKKYLLFDKSERKLKN